MLGYILTSIILIFFSVLFYYIYRQNSKAVTNRSLAFMTLLLGLWSLVNFLENEIKAISIAKIFLDLDFVLAAFSAFYFFRFCISFTYSSFQKYFKFGYLITSLLSLAVISGLIINNIRFYNGTLIFDTAPLFIIYALILFSYILLGSYEIFRKYLKAAGLYRVQLLYVLLGLFISGLIALISNLIFPILNITDLNLLRLGIYGMIFVIGFTSYAILRYRLMDVRVIIRRSTVFAVLVILITAIYTLFAYLISLIFQGIVGAQSFILTGIITAVLVAIAFEPLKTWLSWITDKYLFQAEYNAQEVLAEFADRLTSTLDLRKNTEFLVKRLYEVLKPAYVSVFLLHNDKEYRREAMKGKAVMELSRIDTALFAKIYDHLKNLGIEREILVREEIVKMQEETNDPGLKLLYANLDQYAVNLVVPMYLRDKLIGIMFLGDKKSGDVYSQQDLKILEIIAAQSAVSVQNSLLFEEQKNFTVHLEKVVADRTSELRDANIQLKKLDKAKSEFISIASHQLRTPLTVIKGYLSMVNEGDFGQVPEKLGIPVDRVYKSTLRIINLVEDLLNISRIESGRMKYEFTKTNLQEIVKSVVDELEQQAKNKGLELKYLAPQEKLPDLILDEKKIREVVMNIMDNAIKYTEKGKITVELKKVSQEIIYCVSDTGRGISKDEMSMLFKKFSRAGGAKLVHTEGTGLGLYIAKKIVEKHGGKAWAESEGRDKGSKFCISFKIHNKRLERQVGKG